MRLLIAALIATPLIVACEDSGGPDAIDADTADTGVDARVETSSFSWDPWPSGLAPYRRSLTRCNFNGASPGRCPDGFSCTGEVEVHYAALTRQERVCEADSGVPLRITRSGPYVPAAPIAVELAITIGGAPTTAAQGTLRVLDEGGAEVYSGRVQPIVALEMDTGEFTISLSLDDDETHPAWVRGGQLVVAASGRVELPIERATLSVDVTGAITGERHIVVEHADLGTTLRDPVSLVPGTLRVAYEDGAGVIPLGEHSLTDSLALALDLDPQRVTGSVRVNGAPLTAGLVTFRDPVTGAIRSTEIAAGAYAITLHDRPWDVYLDLRGVTEATLPTQRALVASSVDVRSPVDLDASLVMLRGTVTLNGAPAPSDARLGFLQLVDDLGVAGAGWVVGPGGMFAAPALATRADIVMIGTHRALPSHAQTLTTAVRITDAAVDFDVQSALLDATLLADGRALSDALVPASRGELVVIDQRGRAVRIPLSLRGPARAALPLAPGTYAVRYANSEHAPLPMGDADLGALTVTAGETLERTFDMATRTLDVDAPSLGGALLRFTDQASVSHADIQLSGSGAARARLFAATYNVRELCVGSCGQLLVGWLRPR